MGEGNQVRWHQAGLIDTIPSPADINMTAIVTAVKTMRKNSRVTLAAMITLGFAFDVCNPVIAAAQSWPARPLSMVVPLAAGGAGDVLARILAARLSELLGQQVIVENVGGAGGMTGAYRVAKAAPDGYQFVLGGIGTHAANQTLYEKPLYNATTDFAPVALISEAPIVLIARRDFPANDLQGFIAYAKANYARMQYGSAGVGSAVHLACELLNAEIGVKVTHVPYRGGNPAMQDLIAGRTDYQCALPADAVPQITSRTVKAISILSRDRSSTLPALASAREQGLTDLAASVWNGLFLPRGTPAPIVRKLNEVTIETLETPAVQAKLQEMGATVVAPDRRSPEYLGKFVASEIVKWAAVIKGAGLSAVP
jgi:tripartite-type tricarboxylate transporter receptor subunit TctC